MFANSFWLPAVDPCFTMTMQITASWLLPWYCLYSVPGNAMCSFKKLNWWHSLVPPPPQTVLRRIRNGVKVSGADNSLPAYVVMKCINCTFGASSITGGKVTARCLHRCAFLTRQHCGQFACWTQQEGIFCSEDSLIPSLGSVKLEEYLALKAWEQVHFWSIPVYPVFMNDLFQTLTCLADTSAEVYGLVLLCEKSKQPV